LFKSLKKEHNLKSSGKDLFDASVYRDDNSTSFFHSMVQRLSKQSREAKPSPFHHMLATLADEGRLLRLYSQNVDGIDTSLKPLETQVPLNRKAPWPKTIQLHGNLQYMVCSKCHELSELDPELFNGPSAPICNQCVAVDNARTEHAGKRSHGIGKLRPRMVLYNEHNPDDEAIGAVVKADLHKRPDALIVVGTTLKVPGVRRIVKEMSQIVRDRRGGVTIWMNMDGPPQLKDCKWDMVVKGPCDRVANLVAMRHWDDPRETTAVPDDYEPQTRAEVVIESALKSQTTMLLTPSTSRSSSIPPLQHASKQEHSTAVQQAETKQTAFDSIQNSNTKQSKKPRKKPGAGAKKISTATKNMARGAGSRPGQKSKKRNAASGLTLNFSISKPSNSENPKDSKTPKKSGPQHHSPMQPIAPVDAKINGIPPDQLEMMGEFQAAAADDLKKETPGFQANPSENTSSPQLSPRSPDPRQELNFILNS
jgi:NAD-dependent histone deacetylase SIR2